MMRMSLRLIRAYLAAKVKLQARESIDGSLVAGLHALPSEYVKHMLATWSELSGAGPTFEQHHGKLVETHGGWKVIPMSGVRDFLKGR